MKIQQNELKNEQKEFIQEHKNSFNQVLRKSLLRTSLIAMGAIVSVSCGKSGGGGGGGSSSVSDTSASDTTDTPVANPTCVEKLGLFKESSGSQNISQASVQNEVIIDDLQWQSTTTLKDAMEKSNASSTVYISIPAQGTRCTGFLINDDMVMTNNHCIGNSAQAKGASVKFSFTASGAGEKYSCSNFIGTNKALDFTVLKCSGSPGEKYPKVTLADYPAQVNDLIYITQQNCDYKSNPGCIPTQKYSEGILLGAANSNVEHNADTLPGSSGSPIFDQESDKVIAIHNAGQSYSNGGGLNYGIPMWRIVDYIKDNLKSVEFTSSNDRQPAYQSCGE